MPVLFVSGDPLLTRAQTLVFGSNASGRAEVEPFHTALYDRYPAAFATYGKQCRGGRLKPGQVWLWSEAQPRLLFMIVRDTPASIVKLRHFEAALLLLARDYRLYGLHSLALLLPGQSLEQQLLKPLTQTWLESCPMPTVVYERYQPGVGSDETILDAG